MKLRTVAVIGLVAVFASGCANSKVTQPDSRQAKLPEPREKVQSYLESAELSEIVGRLVLHWDRERLGLESRCDGKYTMAMVSTDVMQPLKFPTGSTHPEQGIWVSRYALTRCGKSKLYNVLLAAREDNDPRAVPMVPGTTLASPLLIHDLRQQGVPLMVGLNSNNPRCKRTAVSDTEVTREPATLDVDGEPTPGVWEERWTVKHCSEIIDITFCLAPDGRGGTNWSSRACKKT